MKKLKIPGWLLGVIAVVAIAFAWMKWRGPGEGYVFGAMPGTQMPGVFKVNSTIPEAASTGTGEVQGANARYQAGIDQPIGSGW